MPSIWFPVLITRPPPCLLNSNQWHYFVVGGFYMKSVKDNFVLEPYISIKLEIEYSLEAMS